MQKGDIRAKIALSKIENPPNVYALGAVENLKGEAAGLKWHVIDWPEGDTEHSRQKHKSSGLSALLENTPVDIAGFYSEQHHGVFTHHSTNIHLHFKTQDGTITGHVDDLTLDGKLKLLLPEK